MPETITQQLLYQQIPILRQQYKNKISTLFGDTKLYLVCVPFKKPFPVNPPEPIAILLLIYIVTGTFKIVFHS